ncbi:MAG: hypothetical protein WAV41_02250 [Microgenomates group bacterium]
MVSQEIVEMVNSLKPLMAEYNGVNNTKETVYLWRNSLGNDDMVMLNPRKAIGGVVIIEGKEVAGKIIEGNPCFLNHDYYSLVLGADEAGRFVLDAITGAVLKIDSEDFERCEQIHI